VDDYHRARRPHGYESMVRECVICMDRAASYIVLDCMHLCLCEPCAEQFKAKLAAGRAEHACPKCRQHIVRIAKTY
jgi:Zn finger protein HypA/HybF involved in hydrogenase expression